MKKNIVLLAGLLLGAGMSLAHSQESPHKNKQDNLQIHPETLLQYQKIAHGIENQQNLPPKPPRSGSPKQLEELHQRQDLSLKSLQKSAPKKSSQSPQSMSSTGLTQSVETFVCTDPEQLLEVSGAELVQRVKDAELTSCMYGLYDISLVGTELFSDANLQSIVQEINAMLASYDATSVSQSSELEKLVTFLRAMHWAESAAGSARVFQASYRSALQAAFSAYFSGEHFGQFNGNSSRNFMLRYEMLILVASSASQSLQFLPGFSEALLGYAATVSRADDWGLYYEENGMTQLLTHLFNAAAYQHDEYANVLAAHPEIVQNLINFVAADGTWLIGHTREYQWADTVSELGRLLKFGGDIAASIRPTLQHILATYTYDGVGGSGWINAQRMVATYDAQNCELYGDACGFNLQELILSGHHQCSATIKIRFQPPISLENLNQTCASLVVQEQLFHQTFDTHPATPVADDLNEDLEVVVFSSYSDYDSYGGDFFDIDTDNGGMYLEGDPADPYNQARFIAYQATWLPDFAIWNLQHEYIHYLDGHFNKWGGFPDQPANSVWWAEGLAEYLSQPVNNPNALAAAASGTYSLSELFQTTYTNGDTARVYHWGYLAVRFMLENQRVEIDDELLPSMRAAKGAVGNEGCQFDWQWRAKPDAEANGWYWQYDDSENGYSGSGYWVWTCGQTEPPSGGDLPEYTPYQDILDSWGSNFDQQFDDWLVCLVAGAGLCETSPAVPGDMDGNQTVDMNDISLFRALLRNPEPLDLKYDFNQDGQVNQLDIRALMNMCDQARCAIAP